MLIIDPGKKYYKGCTHVHTNNTDGHVSPEECARRYANMGFDFMFITDHWFKGHSFDHENLKVFTGIEYDFDMGDPALHIVGLYPGDELADAERGDNYLEVIKKINALGGMAVFAHPAWSLNRIETMLSCEDCAAIEIYNNVSGTPYGPDRAYSGSQIDMAAVAGYIRPLLSGDDTHYYTGEEGTCKNFVQADNCTAPAIIKAIKEGKVWSSTGPEFKKVEYDEKTRLLTVDCSPVTDIFYASNMPWAPNRCVRGENITHAEFKINPKENFVRVEAIDRNNRRAYTSPFLTPAE